MELNVQNHGNLSIIKDIIKPLIPSKIIGIIGGDFDEKTTLLEVISDIIRTSGYNCSLIKKSYDFKYPCIKEEVGRHMKTKNKTRILKSLKIAGISPENWNREIDTLCDSEKYKVKIAQALAPNPHIILFDDIIYCFDKLGKQNLAKLLFLMKARYNRTIFVATDDTDFIHMIADEVIIMNNGILIAKGDKYAIFGNSQLLKLCNIKCPDVIEFSNIVREKKMVDIGYRDNINDLIKDIYRFLR